MKVKGAKNNVIVEGSLIFDNAEQVKEALLARLEKLKPDIEVTVDLSQIEEIDSSGIQLLIAFFKSLQNKQLKYKITNINDSTLEIFELSGLNKFFKFES